MKSVKNKYRVGVDIGGTFTDVVFLEKGGKVITAKVPSTPDNYSKGITNGLAAVFSSAGINGSDVTELVHGCTVATNAILEHTGGPCGLITTKGFRDVLEIRRFRMPEMYNFRWEKPAPLAPRHLRYEVNERIDARGDILCQLDIKEVEDVIRCMTSKGVRSIAVSLMNSYVNPVHERKIKELVTEKYPELCVSLSCELIPIIGEYERTSEAVVNAYIRPLVENYLGQLSMALMNKGIQAPLLLMRSDGGMMSFETGAKKPVYIIECGPAAGVVGAAYLARKLKNPNVLCLDMGGTTTKASLIMNNQISRASAYEVGAGVSMVSRMSTGAGYVIRVSSVDVAEIGAGGGSKLWIDEGGVLHIGPRSAGAVPGPACYNKGGNEPTLTDANLVLGYLNPEYLAGGSFLLDASKAWEAMGKVAKRLGMEIVDAAYGAHMIAVANMMIAIRAITTERGKDPRDFILFVYGGAGPMHAAPIAREMEIKRVVVAPYPGLFSSFGLLFAQIEHRFVENFSHPLNEEGVVGYAGESWERLKNKALAEIKSGGDSKDRVVINKFAALRYSGQSTELVIPIPWDPFTEEKIPLVLERFHAEHFRTYAHKRKGETVEAVYLGVTARVARHTGSLQGVKRTVTDSGGIGSRRAYFGKEYGWLNTPVLGEQETPEMKQKGPAIIERYDSTLLVPPYCQFSSGPWGTVVIDLES